MVLSKKVPIEKLRRWLNDLSADIDHLLTLKETFQGLVSIMKEAPEIVQIDSIYFQFLTHTYSVAQSIGIRRLLDDTRKGAKKKYRRPISLYYFLPEVLDYSVSFTRNRFLRLYCRGGKKRENVIRFANRDFDRCVGAEKQFLQRSLVRKDISIVKTHLRRIKVIVNKEVAHKDRYRRKIKNRPSYNEIDKMLLDIEEIIVKYHMVLFGSNWIRTPLANNWKEIFLVPWSSNGAL